MNRTPCIRWRDRFCAQLWRDNNALMATLYVKNKTLRIFEVRWATQNLDSMVVPDEPVACPDFPPVEWANG